jgi:sigma-B regulation protein RsbU (phosphoserine phosphatase)
MEHTAYEEYSYDGLTPGTVILLGTDGVWETGNEANQLFGSDRVTAILRENHHRSAAGISDQLESALAAFRGEVAPKDDITFVVVKVLDAPIQEPP